MYTLSIQCCIIKWLLRLTDRWPLCKTNETASDMYAHMCSCLCHGGHDHNDHEQYPYGATNVFNIKLFVYMCTIIPVQLTHTSWACQYLSHNRTPASLRLMICSVLAGTCSKLVARLCAPILRSWSMIPHAPLSCRQAPQPSPDRLDRHENTKSTSEASQGSMKRTSSHLDVSAEHQQSQGHTPKKGDRSRI